MIEAAVDSGAVDSVAPPGLFEGLLKPSPMSKSGRKHRGPDGSRIPNLGQQAVVFRSDEGHQCGMTWQIADVERPLIAVSHLSMANNRVVLERDGGEIVHKVTAHKIKVLRKGGVYVVRMWVPQRKTQETGGSQEAQGFQGPGRN